MKASFQENEILVDTSLLREAARRQLRIWLVAGPILLALLAGYQLFVMPQSYTATTSVAVQQSGAGATPLAMLTGQADSHKYIGILHSRLLAEEVEKSVHLQQFYHLQNHRKALTMVTESIKPEDNATEGLLFINATLPGPPRFASDPTGRQERTKQLAATIANLYVAALQRYYAVNDNDRDTVLLRTADEALAQARRRYDSSRNAIRQFIHGLSDHQAIATPNGPNDASSGVPAMLQGLYETENRVEADIRAAEATRLAVASGLNRQLSDLHDLPTEDPLLMTARDRLATAQEDLSNFVNVDQFADDNPRVIRAKNRVRIAKQELDRQLKGYRNHLTSDRLKEEGVLQGLYARRDTVLARIKQAENQLPTRRELGNSLAELMQQQELALASLKNTETKVAELRLTAVSGLSRLKIVDTAIEPEIGQPGLTRVLLVSIAPILLLFGVALFRDYARENRRRALLPPPLEVEALSPPTVLSVPNSSSPSEENGHVAVPANPSPGTQIGRGV